MKNGTNFLFHNSRTSELEKKLQSLLLNKASFVSVGGESPADYLQIMENGEYANFFLIAYNWLISLKYIFKFTTHESLQIGSYL